MSVEKVRRDEKREDKVREEGKKGRRKRKKKKKNDSGTSRKGGGNEKAGARNLKPESRLGSPGRLTTSSSTPTPTVTAVGRRWHTMVKWITEIVTVRSRRYDDVSTRHRLNFLSSQPILVSLVGARHRGRH